MGAQRAHIVLPESLVREIDALVGPSGRSTFLMESAQAEVYKRQLLRFLQDDTPAWKDEAHPELTQGTSDWVRAVRDEGRREVHREPING